MHFNIDPVYLIVAAIVLVQAIQSARVNRILFRHQKALETFSNMVHLDPRAVPQDAPEEVYDLLHEEEIFEHPEK